MTREIEDGDKGEKGAGKVSVISHVPGIKDGDYTNKNDYSEVILRLFGIEERHDYIALQDFTTNHFTMRSFFHMFYIMFYIMKTIFSVKSRH